jgi:hypothetical protein
MVPFAGHTFPRIPSEFRKCYAGTNGAGDKERQGSSTTIGQGPKAMLRLSVLLTLLLSAVVVTPAWADEGTNDTTWGAKDLPGLGPAAEANGLVTWGDSLRIAVRGDDCQVGVPVFTVYTHTKNEKFLQLNDKAATVNFNGTLTKGSLLAPRQFIMGYIVLVQLPPAPLDSLVSSLKNRSELSATMVEVAGAKASEYFDIDENRWGTKNFVPAIQKAQELCRTALRKVPEGLLRVMVEKWDTVKIGNTESSDFREFKVAARALGLNTKCQYFDVSVHRMLAENVAQRKLTLLPAAREDAVKRVLQSRELENAAAGPAGKCDQDSQEMVKTMVMRAADIFYSRIVIAPSCPAYSRCPLPPRQDDANPGHVLESPKSEAILGYQSTVSAKAMLLLDAKCHYLSKDDRTLLDWGMKEFRDALTGQAGKESEPVLKYADFHAADLAKKSACGDAARAETERLLQMSRELRTAWEHYNNKETSSAAPKPGASPTAALAVPPGNAPPRQTGQVSYRDIAGHRVPLPSKGFQVVASLKGEVGGITTSNEALALIEDKKLIAIVFIAATPLTSKVEAGFRRDSRCGRTDVHYLDIKVNYEFGKQDCSLVNHFWPEAWKSEKANRLDRDAANKLAAMGVSLPPALVYGYYSFADRGYLKVYYFFNPEARGITSHKTSSWAESDWHKKYLANDPKKVAFLQDMRQWLQAWHPYVQQAFEGSLKDSPPAELSTSLLAKNPR